MQAWHLMQIPVQVSGASFGIDPIGQTVAQIPHFVHFSGPSSVLPLRIPPVFHQFQVVYNMPRPDHLRGPRSFPGISVNPETFSATFSPNSAIFTRSSASGRPVASLLLKHVPSEFLLPQLYGSRVPQAHSDSIRPLSKFLFPNTETATASAPFPSNAVCTYGSILFGIRPA